jgi:hypothetical protein
VQIEEILSHAGDNCAPRGIDEQGREPGEMFRAGLDGIDPAPLAFLEIRRRQEIADGENSGERGADLMGECGQRRLDRSRSGGLYGTGLGNALAHLARGKAGSTLFPQPLFHRPRGAL